MQSSHGRGSRRSRSQQNQKQRETVIRRACREVAAASSAASSFGVEALEVRQLLTLMIDFRMDEASGDVLIDSAAGEDQGFQQDGFLSAATTRIPGRVGSGAIAFDGTGSVDMTNEVAEYLGNYGTIGFWIRTTQVGTTSHTTSPAITGNDAADDDADAIWGWLDNTGRIALTVNGTVPTGGTNTIRSTNPINNGQWQHVVMSRDADTGVMKLYVNGILQTTGNGPTGSKNVPFRELGAGRVGTTNNYFQGALDEVRIYNHVVDDAEAALLFNPSNTAPSAPTGLAVAQTGARGVVLNWSSTADNESGFRVYQSTGGGAPTLAVTVGSDVNTATVRGLDPSTAYTFYVVAFNPTGESGQSNSVNATTTASAPADDGTGLTGIYYDDGGYDIPGTDPDVIDWSTNFRGKIVIRQDAGVNFDWGSGSPVAGIAPDNFSVAWLGSIKPQYTENFTFFTETDDGGRLYIDLNNDGDFDDANELLVEDPFYHGLGAVPISFWPMYFDPPQKR